MQQVYGQIEQDLGPIHVQVSNAGIAEYKPALEHTPESWRSIFNVNVDGTFYTTQAAARYLSMQCNVVYRQTLLTSGKSKNA